MRRLRDRKSTRLNSSHLGISYAVFCLKKKQKTYTKPTLSTFVFLLGGGYIHAPLHLAEPSPKTGADRAPVCFLGFGFVFFFFKRRPPPRNPPPSPNAPFSR